MRESTTIRPATIEDIGVLAQARRLMFGELAMPVGEHEYEPAFLEYLADEIATDGVGGWIAEDSGEWAGALSVAWIQWAPGPGSLDGKRAYLFGLYVKPEERRQGIARSLVETAIAEARTRNVSVVVLHASSMGRPIYEGMGFESSPEMRLYL